MTQPLVSVVIPVYNVEKYLDKCVQSVVGQTYSNLEIILVDDGSPDRCPELCDNWAEKDSRIRVIHKENAGQGMARNTGMAMAQGKYLFFFDSDDYVAPGIVKKCVESAEKNGSDAVLFGRWDVREDGSRKPLPLSVQKTIFRGEEIRSELLPKLFTYAFGLGVGACGRMYTLQRLREQEIRFPSERETASEDAHLALRVFSCAETVTIVSEQLYYYRQNGNSFSRIYRNDRQEKNDVFLNTNLAYISGAGMPEIVASHLKVRYHFYTIAAMKQIFLSELSEKKKRAALGEIFRSQTLRETLTPDVLRLEKRSQQLFFALLKLRCYGICYLLLKLKAHKQ